MKLAKYSKGVAAALGGAVSTIIIQLFGITEPEMMTAITTFVTGAFVYFAPKNEDA